MHDNMDTVISDKYDVWFLFPIITSGARLTKRSKEKSSAFYDIEKMPCYQNLSWMQNLTLATMFGVSNSAFTIIC